MNTARIKWRSTYKLRYDEVHRDYQCACCGTWFQDDSVNTMNENDVPGIRDMSYCPVCGAELTQQEGVI